MGRKRGAPVVITRKDKRINKTGHLIAFGLTGGLSGAYTATKAATNAGYNARTRKLIAESEATQEPPSAQTQPSVTPEAIAARREAQSSRIRAAHAAREAGLTDKDIRRIKRRLRWAGALSGDLAREYGVPIQVIDAL